MTNQSLIANSNQIVPHDTHENTSIFHKGSVDLLFAQNLAGRKIWIADVHSHTTCQASFPVATSTSSGSKSKNGVSHNNKKELEKTFSNSIVDDAAFDDMLQTLCRFGLLVLHVDGNDFSSAPGFNCVNPAVKDLLPRAQIVVFRDYSGSEHEALVHYLRSSLGQR